MLGVTAGPDVPGVWTCARREELLYALGLGDPSQRAVACELTFVGHQALSPVDVDPEEIDLDRHDVRVRERLHAKEAPVLRSEDAALEVGEVVELPQLLASRPCCSGVR